MKSTDFFQMEKCEDVLCHYKFSSLEDHSFHNEISSKSKPLNDERNHTLRFSDTINQLKLPLEYLMNEKDSEENIRRESLQINCNIKESEYLSENKEKLTDEFLKPIERLHSKDAESLRITSSYMSNTSIDDNQLPILKDNFTDCNHSDNSLCGSKIALKLHNEIKDTLKSSKVVQYKKSHQTYKSKVKQLRSHSNRSKSKDELKECNSTKLKEHHDDFKNKNKLKEKYEYKEKVNDKYIHNSAICKIKDEFKDNNSYRSRSKLRDKDKTSKWDYRSNSSKEINRRKDKYYCNRENYRSDHQYRSRNKNERKYYNNYSKYSKRSRSLSRKKFSLKTKDKLDKNVSYNNKFSNESESKRRSRYSQDKRRSRKKYNILKDPYKKIDKDSRDHKLTKSRSSSRERSVHKVGNCKKIKSNHIWKIKSSDESATTSKKCSHNDNRTIIQNHSKVNSKSLSKDTFSDNITVTELSARDNKLDPLVKADYTNPNNNITDEIITISEGNVQYRDCSMTIDKLPEIVENYISEPFKKEDTFLNLSKDKNTECYFSKKKPADDSSQIISFEQKNNSPDDSKVQELNIFPRVAEVVTSDDSRVNETMCNQLNYQYYYQNQPSMMMPNNQILNFNTTNPEQNNIHMSLPIYNQNVPFNNYSTQSIYQPSYAEVCNSLKYSNFNSLQFYNTYAGDYVPERLTMPSYIPPYIELQSLVNNTEYLSASSYWNLNNETEQENNLSFCQSQEFFISKNLSNWNSHEVSFTDVRNSSIINVKNSVVDISNISLSSRSIDSINDLKLDEIISDKDDLSSCGGFEFEDLELQDPFQKYPDAPRPKYEHIVKTEVHPSAIGKRFDYAYLKSTSCNCVPPNPDEIRMGKAACDENCFNRKIKVECNRRCPVYDLCTNRRFQEQIYAPIEPFYCGQDKGWGIRALSNIPAGTFVIEYVGELIDFNEFLSRISQESLYCNNFLMVIQKNMYLDAGNKGNWARFVNHSCDPNTMIERWVVSGKTRIGFFSKKSILKDEEITIDYQFQQYGSIEQNCYCGTMNCTGIMGKVNEKLQEQIKTSELRYRKELIQRIIARKSLKEITHVSEMITVIKENCLDRDTFFSFLEVLLRSNSNLCIRTFIECGGLNVITSYLDSISWNDWSLKLLYLQCLDHFKLKKRILLNSGYTSATVIDYWSQNPRYILKHVVEDSLDIDSFDDDNDTINDFSEQTNVDNESPIQFSLPDTEEPILEIEKQVQSLAFKIKEYFDQEKVKFFIPKIKNNQIEFTNEFSTNDSESKSISIASSVQGDFIQIKTKRLQNKCTEAIQKLSKDEFRRVFSERYNKSISDRSQAFASNETMNRNTEVFHKIKKLLSNVIIKEINNLKQNDQFYTMPAEFQNLDIDKILLSLNIAEYDDILASLNPLIDENNKTTHLNYTKSSDEILKCDDNVFSTEILPPNWRFCRCENDRIYFYHIITKKTQWESPVYPWDAGEDDPYSYDFGNAQDYQITTEDIKLMHQRRKIQYKEDKLIEKEKKRLERKLNLSIGDRNKIQFSREVFKVVKILMKPYFSSSCKIGRVRSKVDLKFLCEKFAETIIGKEVKLVADLEDLELNSDVSSRITSYVTKYMSSHGRNFKRTKKPKSKSNANKLPNTADSIDTNSPIWSQ